MKRRRLSRFVCCWTTLVTASSSISGNRHHSAEAAFWSSSFLGQQSVNFKVETSCYTGRFHISSQQYLKKVRLSSRFDGSSSTSTRLSAKFPNPFENLGSSDDDEDTSGKQRKNQNRGPEEGRPRRLGRRREPTMSGKNDENTKDKSDGGGFSFFGGFFGGSKATETSTPTPEKPTPSNDGGWRKRLPFFSGDDASPTEVSPDKEAKPTQRIAKQAARDAAAMKRKAQKEQQRREEELEQRRLQAAKLERQRTKMLEREKEKQVKQEERARLKQQEEEEEERKKESRQKRLELQKIVREKEKEDRRKQKEEEDDSSVGGKLWSFFNSGKNATVDEDTNNATNTNSNSPFAVFSKLFTERPPSEQWITVFPKTRIMPGQMVPVTVAGLDLLVIASKDARRLYCIANSCPHLGTPLEIGQLVRLPVESNSTTSKDSDKPPNPVRALERLTETDITNILQQDGCEDCIVCPLHKTAFALESGEVRGEWCPYPPIIGKVMGTVKQPVGAAVFDVRTRGKNVEVRINTPIAINDEEGKNSKDK